MNNKYKELLLIYVVATIIGAVTAPLLVLLWKSVL